MRMENWGAFQDWCFFLSKPNTIHPSCFSPEHISLYPHIQQCTEIYFTQVSEDEHRVYIIWHSAICFRIVLPCFPFPNIHNGLLRKSLLILYLISKNVYSQNSLSVSALACIVICTYCIPPHLANSFCPLFQLDSQSKEGKHLQIIFFLLSVWNFQMWPKTLRVPVLIQPCISLNIIPRNILEKRLISLPVPTVALLPDTRCGIKMDGTMLFLLDKNAGCWRSTLKAQILAKKWKINKLEIHFLLFVREASIVFGAQNKVSLLNQITFGNKL